jgi:hypothetical protein
MGSSEMIQQNSGQLIKPLRYLRWSPRFKHPDLNIYGLSLIRT